MVLDFKVCIPMLMLFLKYDALEMLLQIHDLEVSCCKYYLGDFALFESEIMLVKTAQIHIVPCPILEICNDMWTMFLFIRRE